MNFRDSYRVTGLCNYNTVSAVADIIEEPSVVLAREIAEVRKLRVQRVEKLLVCQVGVYGRIEAWAYIHAGGRSNRHSQYSTYSWALKDHGCEQSIS